MNIHVTIFSSEIDECSGQRGVDYDKDCHKCINTSGSYTCECEDGYDLDPVTKQKCIGGLHMFL